MNDTTAAKLTEYLSNLSDDAHDLSPWYPPDKDILGVSTGELQVIAASSNHYRFNLKSVYKGVTGNVTIRKTTRFFGSVKTTSFTVTGAMSLRADSGGELKASYETLGYWLDKISELPGFVDAKEEL